MTARKILFPTDFSTCSEAALERATALARDSGATLLIVHVEEPPAAYAGGEMYYGLSEPDQTAVLRMLHDVRPTDPCVPYEHKLVRGNPADEIIAEAELEHCDLIVMATHGRTGLLRLLMGSVTEAVIRQATCPVMTCKPHARETKPMAAAIH